MWPRAETPTDYIVLGANSDLTKATKIAVQQAVGFLMELKHLPRVESYRLVSLAGNVRITELVDGTVGVHVMLPKGIFGK